MTTNKYNSDAASTLTNPTGYVWVVVGETGQYSDYTEWNVAGFETEQLAEEFKNLCQVEADKVNGQGWEVRDGFRHKYDTQFYCDYTGTRYLVAMVEVYNSLPQNAKD